MIEGSGFGPGSIPLTSGSGSGRPNNMWIRIRNTTYNQCCGSGLGIVSVAVQDPDFLIPNSIIKQKIKIMFYEGNHYEKRLHIR
jgi:hypothetical protein